MPTGACPAPSAAASGMPEASSVRSRLTAQPLLARAAMLQQLLAARVGAGVPARSLAASAHGTRVLRRLAWCTAKRATLPRSCASRSSSR